MDTAPFDDSQHSWQALQDAWRRHGNTSAFWTCYQQVLEQASDKAGDPGAAANQLALMAQRLGAVDRALII